MTPVAISAKLGGRAWTFVEQRDVGFGFKIESDPGTVRAADVSFVSYPPSRRPANTFAAIAPDLVAEILSLEDRPGEVVTGIGEWLGAGTRLVWVIDPERAQARVHRADRTW